MKKVRFLLIIFFLFLTPLLYANTGAGIIIGEPTGFSIKHSFNEKFAIDGALGYSFKDALDIHSDFLVLFDGLMKEKNLFFYFGAGLKMRFPSQKDENKRNEGNNDSFRMGPRFPIGISYLWKKHKLEFFFELAPLIVILPDLDAGLDGGIGVRYYFN